MRRRGMSRTMRMSRGTSFDQLHVILIFELSYICS
jgi:hypothetical protein